MQESPQNIVTRFLQNNSIAVEQHTPAFQQLRDAIQYLIESDFYALVQLLYRIDVDEKLLRQTLHEHQENDAAELITQLLIERQAQKIAWRKKMNQNKNISEDEKW
ncbi:MAG: hypothetical protein EKK39_00095 [Sphingobacteriales bacterium]|uniref:hypothetical protein n=1 Tax=Hydrotalea flava TaxID=714549 RepID=UPI0008325B2D|nr:hypothetical protein [Hydrotalea flava]RTL56925.1 MAG: hypothetical protein EKK39_00095 [Sphingobacteriales bacterium]